MKSESKICFTERIPTTVVLFLLIYSNPIREGLPWNFSGFRIHHLRRQAKFKVSREGLSSVMSPWGRFLKRCRGWQVAQDLSSQFLQKSVNYSISPSLPQRETNFEISWGALSNESRGVIHWARSSQNWLGVRQYKIVTFYKIGYWILSQDYHYWVVSRWH